MAKIYVTGFTGVAKAETHTHTHTHTVVLAAFNFCFNEFR